MRQDAGGFDPWHELNRDEKVVDAPSDVARTRTVHVAPPRVVAVALGEETESVDKAVVDQRLKFRPFLVGKTGVFPVGPGVGQIVFGVRDIEVAANDDRLFLFQFFEVRAKSGLPLLSAIFQAGQFALGIRRVDIDQEKVLAFEGNHAPLAVVLLNPDAAGGVLGFLLGERGSAGIAGFFRGVPMRREAARPGDLGDLLGFGFDFLQAEHIGLFGVPKFEEALAENRAEAIDVPGDEFHKVGSV